MGITGNFEAGGHPVGIAMAGDFEARGHPIGLAIGIAGNFEAVGLPIGIAIRIAIRTIANFEAGIRAPLAPSNSSKNI